VQKIVRDIEEKKIPGLLAETYRLEEIALAHRRMEANNVNGKIVVLVDHQAA
jgi:NADPH:quinone reductase-like Zn-dependent oxidoreductase